MKVTIAALGRFHAFDLAEQLRQHDQLDTLFTGYPAHKVPGSLRPFVKTCPALGVPGMLAGRMGLERLQDAWNVWATVLFDQWVTRHLKPCDVFHCWASYGVQATIRAKQLGAKTICDRGSTHVLHQRRILRQEAARWGVPYRLPSERLALRELTQYQEADVITVPSGVAADTFAIHHHKAAIVPYGVDLHRFQPMDKEDKLFRVLYVGALSLRKGLVYLLQGFARAMQRDWNLELVGTPLAETEGLRQSFLPPQTTMWGAIPQANLPWFYSQADVVVMPSLEEGLALVLGQALACGTPVMATRESGVEELITPRQEGIVIRARSPEDIATELTRFYDHPKERQSMRRTIAKRRDEWHWRHYGRKMLEVYAT